MLTATLSGFGLGLSLIAAIGAQNAFVLRQGIQREHVTTVALVCIASDAVLITTAVAGVGALLTAAPWLLVAVRWVGAAFLIAYGLLAARRAWRPPGEVLAADQGGAAATVRTGGGTTATLARTRGVARVLATCLALTWLNPHVYLDVMLLGTVASTHDAARWWFAAGAIVASTVWFTALAFGARAAGRWLRSPRAWRALDAGIAIVMVVLGVGLVASA